LAALLHGTLVVGVSQTLRRWTEGATYIRQGGHHVRHWPTFLVTWCSCSAVQNRIYGAFELSLSLYECTGTGGPQVHATAGYIEWQIVTVLSGAISQRCRKAPCAV